MKMEGIPFETTDWADVAPVEYPGETGNAIWSDRGTRRSPLTP